MSGNNYGHYYPQATGSYPEKQWSEWMIEQQQFNDANFIRPPPPPPSYSSATISHTTYEITHTPPPRNPYYNYHTTQQTKQNNTRNFHGSRRYSSSHHYSSSSTNNWNRNSGSGYKRSRHESDNNSIEPKSKSSKKKKKPLSQNVPNKKDWTLEEAEKALNCEKEYNKRHKNQSLIIKFPDLELNKEIVSKFHNAIENVHFQQPSTARFCFVTLEDTADATTVISDLNKIKFGGGFLTAEYKKDREEDQNIGPEDIDPHTLYVGNLAQEITKEEMVKTYPKCKRIDIGYAKKMKYTRYAFVTFKSVADTIEAFKKTHSTQMYSKSLIVRFRRLHGTVGMPGESKPQNPPKSKDSQDSQDSPAPERIEPVEDGQPTPPDNNTESEKDVNLELVKNEPVDSDEDYSNGSDDDNMFKGHVPMCKVKDEKDEHEEPTLNELFNNGEADAEFIPKKENSSDDDDDSDDSFNPDVSFSEMFNNLVAQRNNLNSFNNTTKR